MGSSLSGHTLELSGANRAFCIEHLQNATYATKTIWDIWFGLPATSQLTLTTLNLKEHYENTSGPFDFLAVGQLAYPGLLRCFNAPRPSCPLYRRIRIARGGPISRGAASAAARRSIHTSRTPSSRSSRRIAAWLGASHMRLNSSASAVTAWAHAADDARPDDSTPGPRQIDRAHGQRGHRPSSGHAGRPYCRGTERD
jgi:hypothetical protein